MKVNQNRSLLAYILLTIVTCGIYQLYFIHSFAKDVNIMCAGDGKKTTGLLGFFLLSLVTCGIYSLVWWYLVSERIGDAQARIGQPKDIDGTKFLLFGIVGSFVCGLLSLYAYYLLFKGSNAVAKAHNGN